jgi:hypothetical protein
MSQTRVNDESEETSNSGVHHGRHDIDAKNGQPGAGRSAFEECA